MDKRGPLAGGIVAGLLGLVTLWLVGRLGAGEARLLLESALPTIRFLCSTTAAAATTILALMLTLLSLSQSMEQSVQGTYYERIQQISLFCTICLTLSIFVLLMLVVPLGESDKVPAAVYTGLYYLIMGSTAALGGLMVAIVLMLYSAVTGLVHLVHPEAESALVSSDDP